VFGLRQQPRLAEFPELLAEWHPALNGSRQPADIKADSGRPVWWRCTQGHEWQATPIARTDLGAGCPACRADRLGGRDLNAGASARAEYDRRLERHKEASRARRPTLLMVAAACAIVGAYSVATGGFTGWVFIAIAVALVSSLVATPNTITAWGTGAEGEVLTARYLASLEPDGFVILHDRKIPGSRHANIDHIVIGPPGIYVVETKSLGGRVEIRGGDVFVAGRRRTQMLEEARREALAVQVALGAELEALELGVTPVICVHRARLPFFRPVADGIRIVAGSDLVSALRRAEPILDPDEVEGLAAAASGRLRPATTAAT
jgi:hypothetical protein